jgi:predicted AAA+ superfamily ATPase
MAKNVPTWTPTPNDISSVLSSQNPWFSTGQVPDVLARSVERPLAKTLWRRVLHNKPQRFQVILGPRRVGKTTSMYQTARHLVTNGIDAARIWWYRLDHPLLMQNSLATIVQSAINTVSATAENPLFMFLDELTYAREWDAWLKTFYDDAWPIRIVGSSSSTAALRTRRHESGVGRWDEQYLAPYLFKEYLELVGQTEEPLVGKNLNETIEKCFNAQYFPRNLGDHRRRFLLTGGFPELLIPLREILMDDASLLLQSQQVLRSDAVERAIYKDIPQAFGVDNPQMLERLLYTLAGQISGILSPTSICQNLGGLSQPTFDRYLEYLRQSFLVFTLENYSGSEISKQKRGRKLYFVDGAVRNAALQRGTGPLQDPGEMGLLFENTVAAHLHALSQQGQVRVYYWRDKQDEVDFIYDHPEEPLAFEIGSSASHHRRGLQALMIRYPKFKGRCFFLAPELIATMPGDSPDRVGTLPLDMFLLMVSAQAEREMNNRLHALANSETAIVA